MSTELSVIGGGYAGVMAANRAIGYGAHVTLLNAGAAFVERIRLHEVAAGSRANAELSLASLLHPEVELIVGWAERINAEDRTILLADGRTLGYDHLVYAVGSASAPMPSTSFGVATHSEALALRAQLMRPESRNVEISGAGFTGIELAAEIAFARPDLRVRLRSRGQIGSGLGIAGRHAVRRRLEWLGIEIIEHERTDPDRSTANVAVSTAGFAVPALARASGLPVSANGRLLVAADLGVPGNPGIVGAGDAVLVAGGSHLRMSCAAALPQGAHAVDSIFEGSRPLNAGFMLQCVSLGRRHGVIQLVGKDDGPRNAHLTGALAAVAKEAMSRKTVRWLRREAARPGIFRWPSGPSLTRDLADPPGHSPTHTAK